MFPLIGRVQEYFLVTCPSGKGWVGPLGRLGGWDALFRCSKFLQRCPKPRVVLQQASCWPQRDQADLRCRQ